MDHRAAIETVGLVVDAAGVAVIVIAIGSAGLSFARARSATYRSSRLIASFASRWAEASS